MMKTSSLGSSMRKRSSDVTNLHSSHKSHFESHHDDDHHHDDVNNNSSVVVVDDFSIKKHIQHLLQENAMMIKLIHEKDKIIELNGHELQKLRIHLHGTRLQNWYLAQSNTQMLAELNMCKDRLRALRHELTCKDTLNKAKSLYLQDQTNMQQEENSVLEEETQSEKKPLSEPKLANDNTENKVSITKRGRSLTSQSLEPPTSEQAADKEITENKRRCVRKQPVSLKPEETLEDLIEINVPSLTECEDETQSEKAFVPEHKPDSDYSVNKVPKTKRARPARSQSLGPSKSQQAVDKETDENKRRCLERQHVTLKPEETPDNLFEINVTPFHKSVNHSSATQKEEAKAPPSQSSTQSLPRRSSTGRPVRKAAEKIQSYEAPTLKLKIRKPE